MRTRWILALVLCFLALSPLAPVLAVRAQVPGAALVAPCDGGNGAYLYADRDYGGACVKLTESAPNLGALGFDNMASSLRFVGSYAGGHLVAELYTEVNYGGSISIVSTDDAWLGDNVGGDNSASSVSIHFTCSGVSAIPQAECQALVDLYNQTHGPSWTHRTNWLWHTNPCTWFGVTCSASGHVRYLELFNNQLQGALPASLGNLTSLEILRLYQNQLTGSIPDSLGNLTSLLDLSLHANQLSDSIPSSLGSLSALQGLSLQNNQLSGGIPSSLMSLSNLRWLHLASNELTGNIPSTFRYLTSLVGLYVQDNHLGGALPMSLMEMPALQAFHFEQTGLCEPPDAAFQAWLAGMLELGRTGILCSQPSPTPTATPTVTATPRTRLYLPVVLRAYSAYASDEFTAASPDWRWLWLREDATHWSLSARPGYLRITSQPGTLFYTANDARNVLLREAPPGDWEVRTRVIFMPTKNIQLAGLVVYGDDDNFMLLSHAFCDLAAPSCVGNGIYFDLEQGGTDSGLSWWAASPGAGEVYLRLVRHGGTYTGYFSTDGENWTWVGDQTPGPGLPAVRVGLLAMNHGMSPEDYFDIPADFDWFRMTPAQ